MATDEEPPVRHHGEGNAAAPPERLPLAGANSENPSLRPPAQEEEESRRPKDTPFRQQRVKAWIPILTPRLVIACFVVIGVIFIPVGDMINRASDDVVTYSYTYDDGASAGESGYTGCELDEAGSDSKTCLVSINIDRKMAAPIYVYYELDNFFQNHRRYVRSRSSDQLTGVAVSPDSNCDPLQDLDGVDLNPCGLIANSLFNDTFSLTNHVMVETGIAWESDQSDRFSQPDDFVYAKVGGTAACSSSNNTDANCKACLGDGKSPCGIYVDGSDEYLYFYPDDDDTLYLYELYPDIVSPIEGVMNEHFQVWMRTAGLSTFRKLYGRIESDLAVGSHLTFNVTAAFYVDGFDGKKRIVVSTLSRFGARNEVLGWAYIAIGTLSLAMAVGFFVKDRTHPRKLGDTRFLQNYR